MGSMCCYILVGGIGVGVEMERGGRTRAGKKQRESSFASACRADGEDGDEYDELRSR